MVAQFVGELVEVGLEELDEQPVGALGHGVAGPGLVADVGDRHAHAAEPAHKDVELVGLHAEVWTVERSVVRGGWS